MEEYVALYKEGLDEPCAVVKASYAQSLIRDLEEAMGCKYWTKPVDADEIREIRRETEAISLLEELGRIFSNAGQN